MLKETLFRMADQKQPINGKVIPLQNGVIGEGGFGLVYKGKMVSGTNSIVAMKFVKLEHIDEAKREYEIYSYLNAVDNAKECERFGIPNVYYYHEWKEHMIIVLSYFNGGDLIDVHTKGHFLETFGNQCINSLILFREFVSSC